jgi:chromosome partitioning protein
MNPGAPDRPHLRSLVLKFRRPLTDLAGRQRSRIVRSIGVVNLKGGSGKTTTALSVAVGATLRNLRVLLIDSDPQANATMTMLDGNAPDDPTLGHVLLDQASATEAIRPSRLPGLDLIPADSKLADVALLLAEQLGRERRLRGAMQPLHSYDLAIVDSAPQLSLTLVNVLNTVNELLVPVDAGLYSLAGLGKLQETVDQVRKYLDNPTLRIGGLVLTRVHRNKATDDIETQLRAAFGELVHQSTIPHSTRVEEAHARNRTVIEFAPKSAPSVAYLALLTEILEHGKSTGYPDAAKHADQADAA